MIGRLFPNPDVVFWLGENSKIVAYNCYEQRTFKLKEEYFRRLKSWDGFHEDEFTSMDYELLDADLVCHNKVETNDWLGDHLSFLSHRGSRISNKNSEAISEKEFTKEMIQFAQTRRPPSPLSFPLSKKIKLPAANLNSLQEISLLECFQRRKTSRDFNGRPISLELLSTLLSVNFSEHESNWDGEADHSYFVNGRRKIAPSASGLSMFSAFLVVLKGSYIEPGIYFYEPQSHSLQIISLGLDPKELSHWLMDQYWCKDLAAGIFLVGDIRCTWTKDKGTRGYITNYLEAGHCSQNLLLTATAMNLNTWITGTFRDEKLSESLKIVKKPYFPFFFVGLGYGSNKAIPRQFQDHIEGRI